MWTYQTRPIPHELKAYLFEKKGYGNLDENNFEEKIIN